MLSFLCFIAVIAKLEALQFSKAADKENVMEVVPVQEEINSFVPPVRENRIYPQEQIDGVQDYGQEQRNGVHECVHAFVRACVHVCVRVYVYVCVHMHVCVCVRTCMLVHIFMRVLHNTVCLYRLIFATKYGIMQIQNSIPYIYVKATLRNFRSEVMRVMQL